MLKDFKISYKGYHATVWFDEDEKIFFGVIEDISDCVCFESKDENKVEEEFIVAVDEYIEILDQ